MVDEVGLLWLVLRTIYSRVGSSIDDELDGVCL